MAPEIAERYDLRGPSGGGHGRPRRPPRCPPAELEARQVSRYPAVDLDMAFVVDDDIPASDVEATIQGGADRSGRVGCSFRRLARPLYG